MSSHFDVILCDSFVANVFQLIENLQATMAGDPSDKV